MILPIAEFGPDVQTVIPSLGLDKTRAGDVAPPAPSYVMIVTCRTSSISAPVTRDYRAGDNTFTGAITWVRLDLGDDDHSHLTHLSTIRCRDDSTVVRDS